MRKMLMHSEMHKTLLPECCCTSRQLILCLFCWSLRSIWMCVLFIELTDVVCQTKQNGPWTIEIDEFILSGSVYVVIFLQNDQANLNNNPKWSNQVKNKQTEQETRSMAFEQVSKLAAYVLHVNRDSFFIYHLLLSCFLAVTNGISWNSKDCFHRWYLDFYWCDRIEDN